MTVLPHTSELLGLTETDMKFTKHTCCEIVFNARHGNSYSCGKTAGYEAEGKRYCLRHHPENVQRRQETRAAMERQKWHEESVARATIAETEAEVKRKAACYDDLLSALQTVSAYWAGGDVPVDINAAMQAAIAKATGAA